MDVKAISGRMDSLSVGEALSHLAFGKSCHQPASFSHRSLAHSTENRCLHFIKKVLTIPYTRPKTKEGFMKKTEVIYDKYYDCYLCPGVQELPHCTTTKEGYRQYVSYPLHCKECPLLSQCTQSKNHQKLIQRHVWEQHRVFEKLSMQAMFTFVAMDLKNMSNWLWKTRKMA